MRVLCTVKKSIILQWIFKTSASIFKLVIKQGVKMKNKLYAYLSAGAAVGALASFIQTIEKINLLKNVGVPLKCDLNSVFSCSNVLNSWQSSVFGFPNSLMCLFFFTF